MNVMSWYVGMFVHAFIDIEGNDWLAVGYFFSLYQLNKAMFFQ